MELFTDLAEFERITGDRPKWVRTAQAIRTAPAHREGAMHSIGDSLTYVRTRRRYATEEFVGHRRYLEVVAPEQTHIELEIAKKSALSPRGEYRDATDREHFEGAGHLVTLEPGQILCLDIDEAVRYPAEEAAAPYTVLHVTVEGATFHNK